MGLVDPVGFSNVEQFEQSVYLKAALGSKKDLLVRTYVDINTGNYWCTQVTRASKYDDPKESGMWIPRSRVDTVWELITQWPKPINPITKNVGDIPENCKIRPNDLQLAIIMKFNLKCTPTEFKVDEHRYPYYQYPLYVLQNQDKFRKARIHWRLK
jgi:hypothetical protein